MDGSAITGSIATQTLADTSTTVSVGYYAATTLTAVDSDLATGNIKSGITIFGVPGTTNVVDTTTGDAVATDIANGKVAYVDGSAVTGSLYGGCTCAGTITGTRWCDNNGDGTVTDLIGDTTNNNVGRCLVWLKNANCAATLAGVAKTAKLSWDNANIWSSALVTGTCSLTDSSTAYEWRLPTRAELDGITNGTDPVLSPSIQAFSNVQAGTYRSSTTNSTDTTIAWVVSLFNGTVSSSYKSTTGYVWPVRGP